MVLVEYNSNNSGGSWWLKDEDWFKLEQHGWKIDWYKDAVYKGKKEHPKGRFLGALASTCSKEFPNLQSGIDEWELITGQWSGIPGCECCGPPHSFALYDGDNWIQSG